MPGAEPSPVRRGWWGRNWKWVVPTGCLTVIVLFFVFVVTIALAVFGMLKETDVYKTAVTRAKNDPRVATAIGTPIKEGGTSAEARKSVAARARAI